MTPRWWNDWPATSWSAHKAKEQEKREWFALWSTFIGGIVVLVILAALGVK